MSEPLSRTFACASVCRTELDTHIGHGAGAATKHAQSADDSARASAERELAATRCSIEDRTVHDADVWSTIYTPHKPHANYTSIAVNTMNVPSPCVHTLGNRLRGLNVAADPVSSLGGDRAGWVHRYRLPLPIRAPTSCIIIIIPIS